MDQRLIKTAEHIINYSCKVKKNDKVYIQVIGEFCPLIDEIVRLTYEKSAIPYISQITNHHIELMINCDDLSLVKKALEFWANSDVFAMEQIDCYIEVQNDRMLSDIKSQNLNLYKHLYYRQVHFEHRMKRTTIDNLSRWVTIRYPSEIIFSHCDSIDTNQNIEWVLNLYSYDYLNLSRRMNSLVALMNNTNLISIRSGKTNLDFSVAGQYAFKCDANINIPDGEVYIGPIRNSINGILDINIPTWYAGSYFDHITFKIENGRVIEYYSDNDYELNRLLNCDEGSSYFGEFAFGTNPLIDRYIGNTVFDEKRLGSIHFALGNCLEGSPNGNYSSIHWDLIVDLHCESIVLFDGVIIMRNGVFCLDDLIPLNN